LNNIAEVASNLPESRKSVAGFIKTVLFKHPQLIKDAILVFKDVIKQNLGMG
jgi:hypothetical protein